MSFVGPAQRLQLGGAEQVLYDALKALSTVGAQVTILCPENFYFEQTGLAEVIPCLRTLDYAWGLLEPASPHLRLLDLREIGRRAKTADVVLSVDRPFPLHVDVPVALMLLTGAYWEVLRSLFMPTYDRVIVPSDYLASITRALAGPQCWSGSPPDLRVVPPCVDARAYARTAPAGLAGRLGLDTRRPYLLCPHRSEPEKGFDMAVDIIGDLARTGTGHHLLVPLRRQRPGEEEFRRDLLARARSRGVQDRLVFHDWLPAADVAEYLCLGEWTLRMGTVPESFGLTPLKSVSCGTPVLCTPAGALRRVLPHHHGLRYAWYDDVAGAVEAILHHRPSAGELDRGRSYIERHYSWPVFEEGFLDALLTTRKGDRHFDPSLPYDDRLAPWCAASGDRVWNDYTARQVDVEPEVAAAFTAAGDADSPAGGFRVGDRLSAAQLRRARGAGLVIGDGASDPAHG